MRLKGETQALNRLWEQHRVDFAPEIAEYRSQSAPPLPPTPSGSAPCGRHTHSNEITPAVIM